MKATAEEMLAAATAAVQSMLALGPTVYAAGDVPGANAADSASLPVKWLEVGVSRSSGGLYRRTGRASTSLHYLTVGAADANSPSVRRWQERARAALEGIVLDLGAVSTTPLRFYGQDEVTYLRDVARYWQISTYTFAI